MSERLSAEHVRSAIACCIATTVLASAGCTAASEQSTYVPVRMERCFDAPQPGTINKQINPHNHSRIITLHYEQGADAVREMPNISNRTLANLKAGNVKVMSGAAVTSSGFIARGRDNKPVVVTTAHGVSENDLSQVQIRDQTGNTVDVQNGCYMYENNGAFADLGDTSLQMLDVAILRPAAPLKASPLTIAKKDPARASWLQFVNTQLDGSPTHPSSYAGMVMTPSSNPQGIVALTGLEPHGGNHEGFEYTTHSGASGSLAANMQTGQIEGMAYGSTKGNDNADTTWQPADTILNLYDVSFNVPVGHETGIYPVETNIIGAPVLRKALTSGRY